jgi:hypothetical protein
MGSTRAFVTDGAGGFLGDPLPRPDSVAAELALAAPGAVERELRRLVVGEPRLPALLVGRQPASVALSAGRDQRDALRTH